MVATISSFPRRRESRPLLDPRVPRSSRGQAPDRVEGRPPIESRAGSRIGRPSMKPGQRGRQGLPAAAVKPDTNPEIWRIELRWQWADVGCACQPTATRSCLSSCSSSCSPLSIDVAPVADPHDEDHDILILDRADQAIMSDPVFPEATELRPMKRFPH